MESSLTIKGQVTIPKEARVKLGLKAGERVRFFFHPAGYLAVLPKLPASALRGILPARGKAPSIEDMDRSIAEAVQSRDKSSRRK